MPRDPKPSEPVLVGGSARPIHWFIQLCALAGIRPKIDVETGEERPWLLKDLRKTCATYYDAHLSVEKLPHRCADLRAARLHAK